MFYQNSRLYWVSMVTLLSLVTGCLPVAGGPQVPLPTVNPGSPVEPRDLSADPTIEVKPFFPESLPAHLPAQWSLKGRTPMYQEKVQPLLPRLSADNITATVEKLSSYTNRWYKSPSGVKSALWIRDQFVKYAQGRADIEVDVIHHVGFDQPTIVARIKGRGEKASEKVIIGGHEDTINSHTDMGHPDAVAPGADDNASGIAGVLEVFRVLAQSGFRPERTLEFIAYAGEEVGLLGSQYLAKKYLKDAQKVVGVMQLDGTMYPGPDGTTPKIVFIDDYANPDLTLFSAQLVDTYLPDIRWEANQCGYGCSDHASWTLEGYPSVFPYEAPLGKDNQSIHSTEDDIKLLDPKHGLLFAKLGLAFMVELAQ